MDGINEWRKSRGPGEALPIIGESWTIDRGQWANSEWIIYRSSSGVFGKYWAQCLHLHIRWKTAALEVRPLLRFVNLDVHFQDNLQPIWRNVKLRINTKYWNDKWRRAVKSLQPQILINTLMLSKCWFFLWNVLLYKLK